MKAFLAFASAIVGLGSGAVSAKGDDAHLKGYNIKPTGLSPVYPAGYECSRLTSLCASWIDVDGSHLRQVDDQAIVTQSTAADIVAAAPDGGEQIVLAREVDGGDDVGQSRASGYQGRPLDDARVPHATRILVAAVVRREQVAVERGFQALTVWDRHK